MKIQIKNQIERIELPFELARRLLTTCEDVLLLNKPVPPTALGSVWRWMRGLIDPLFLIFHGASRMSGSFGLAIAFFIFIPALINWALKPIGLVSSENSMEYIYIFWGFLAMAITFAMPSRYALTGYNRKDVTLVIERIPDLYSCTKGTLTALQSCLQRAEEDTKTRLITTKWVGGAVFALAIYLGQKGFDLKDGSLIGYAFLPLIIAAFITGLIAIHARGTIAVYGLAYVIVHQLEGRLDTRPKKHVVHTRWLVRKPPSILVNKKSNVWRDQWTK